MKQELIDALRWWAANHPVHEELKKVLLSAANALEAKPTLPAKASSGTKETPSTPSSQSTDEPETNQT